MMKGIVLAGGSGTRLHPITLGVSKQLLPVYDKPMIYYPISVLMLAGINDILVISTPQDLPQYRNLLGDGSSSACSFSYAEQPSPDGLAQAFLIGEEFIGNDPVCLILGDNIFHGQHFGEQLRNAAKRPSGATVFGYWVKDPERFGVIDFDERRPRLVDRRKAENTEIQLCRDRPVFLRQRRDRDRQGREAFAARRTGDHRRQQRLPQRGDLHVERFGRGFAWLDTGTHDSLLEASQYVQTIEHRQGLKVACLEEIAYEKGWINREQLLERAKLFRQDRLWPVPVTNWPRDEQ